MKSFSYYDLLELFSQPGCAICTMLKADGEHFISSLLYEFVVEPDAHNKIRASLGLCRQHGTQLTQTREGMIGVAVLYQSVVDEALTLMESEGITGRIGRVFSRQGVADKLQPNAPCMCCTYLDDAEARYLRVMADGLSEPKFTAAYQESGGLCLQHTRGVLRLLNNPPLVELVIKHQRAVWEKLKAELALYIVRYGQRADGIDEAMGEEATSWQRAVRLFASDAD